MILRRGMVSWSSPAVTVFVVWVVGVVLLETLQPNIDRGLIEKISGIAGLMILHLLKESKDKTVAEDAKKAADRADDAAAVGIVTQQVVDAAQKELQRNTELTQSVQEQVEKIASS